jgi:hypothetical protein
MTPPCSYATINSSTGIVTIAGLSPGQEAICAGMTIKASKTIAGCTDCYAECTDGEMDFKQPAGCPTNNDITVNCGTITLNQANAWAQNISGWFGGVAGARAYTIVPHDCEVGLNIANGIVTPANLYAEEDIVCTADITVTIFPDTPSEWGCEGVSAKCENVPVTIASPCYSTERWNPIFIFDSRFEDGGKFWWDGDVWVWTVGYMLLDCDDTVMITDATISINCPYCQGVEGNCNVGGGNIYVDGEYVHVAGTCGFAIHTYSIIPQDTIDVTVTITMEHSTTHATRVESYTRTLNNPLLGN